MQLLQLFLAAIVFAQTSSGFSTSCASSTDTFKVTALDVGPNPVAPGKPLNIKLSGNLTKQITNGATVQVTVKFGFIKVFSSTADFCVTEGQNGHPCPMRPGPLSLTSAQALPGIVPSGTYNLKLEWKNQDGSGITCVSGDLIIQR
jgi:hypothetical protein